MELTSRRGAPAMALLAAFLELSSCRQAPPPPRPPSHGILRVMTRAPVTSLDPQTNDDDHAARILANVYDALTDRDAEGRLLPALATAWINPSERTWRFTLRPGVRFQDGRPFTARDVAHTLTRGLTHPSSWIRSRLPLVASVRATGDLEVEIETREKAPLLLGQLATVGIFPAGSDDQLAGAAVGTGAYRVGRFTPGREVSLEAWEGSWRGRARWRQAVFGHEPDGAGRVDALLRGEVDLVEEPPASTLARIQQRTCRVVPIPGRALAVLGLDVTPRPGNAFARKEARRALDRALDRTELVKEALEGQGVEASQLALPGVFGYVRDLGPSMVAPDTKAAPSDLSELEPGRGAPTVLDHTERDRAIASTLARQAARAGLLFTTRERPWEELSARLQARRSPAFLIQVTFPSADASDLLDDLHTRTVDGRSGAYNFTGFSDPSLDDLLDDAASEFDPTQRFAVLTQAMRVAVASRAMLPLCIPTTLFASCLELETRADALSSLRLDQIVIRGDAPRTPASAP